MPRLSKARREKLRNSVKNSKTKTESNAKLKIAQLNVQGLKGRRAIVENFLLQHKIDLCVLQETKLCKPKNGRWEGISCAH